jgi:biopolymer transport protein ExbD
MHHPGRGKKAKQAVRELPEEDPEFQIAPMIDILLVLLVFFMAISSTEVLQVNDQVKLPVAKDAKQKEGTGTEGQVIVNILWNEFNNIGTIDIDGNEYPTAAEITPVLQARVNAAPDLRILVRADKMSKYEYIRSVLRAAGAAGVANVTFSVVDKDAGGGTPEGNAQ